MADTVDRINWVLWYLINQKREAVAKLFADAVPFYRDEWLDRDPIEFWFHLDAENRDRLVALATEHYAKAIPIDRLIAAAPELLEAARLAEQYLSHPDVQAIPFALPASKALRNLCAAIAKAEGRD